ncbi:MAG: polysaccharide pyruvyl transferase family protein [Rubritalea sp.]|tara:strand:+ start:106 stop:1158 length:1053 start_codon:yes stop_codon:yes gene_type:complete
MNIGILTFHRGPNYGGYLQAWHMREAIRSLGHKATIINYQGAKHTEAERFPLKGIKPSQLKGYAYNWLKSRPFRAPVEELSDHRFTTKADEIPWAQFDKVIVGADVVWDHTHPLHGQNAAFFGAFEAQKNAEFVAYAPSCGESTSLSELPDYVIKGLNRFSTIYVRDEATAKLVEKVTGNKPPLVVDPTWLQNDPTIRFKKRPTKPYALVYGPVANTNRANVLKKYCDMRGLQLLSAASLCKTADRVYRSLTPFEWVDLFRHAECVITCTFHGLLYAIKYNKPVIFLVRGPSRSKTRLTLDRCGLHDRVVDEGELLEMEYLENALSPDNPTKLPIAWIRESRAALKLSMT